MGWDQKLFSCLPLVVEGGICDLTLPEMPQQKISSSNTVRNCSNNSDQKENDNSPETKPEGTEIYKLKDREFKIAVIKKLNELQGNSERQVNEFRNKNNEQKEYFTK